MMKIHIIYDFKDGPYGGGNQFLKALRTEYEKIGVYTNNPKYADIYLFSGYPFPDFSLVNRLHRIKLKNADKLFIFRLDGPILYLRGKHKHYDFMLKEICRNYMDGIIFQSQWSRRKNRELTGIYALFEKVINNAADNKIFNPKNRLPFINGRKIKIIATSWSDNIRKGFDAYCYLDKHLDWSRYEMTFVGNSPVVFKNINNVKPLCSVDLAQLLKQHDIYLTASRSDPCSNSLIEALSCGLPAVALDDGGHSELLGKGGILFRKMEEIPARINSLVNSYESYRRKIPNHDIRRVAYMYLEFCKNIKKNLDTDKKDLPKLSVINFHYQKLRSYNYFFGLFIRLYRRLHFSVW